MGQPKKTIIVVSGKKQAGKNTFCNMVLAHYLNGYQGHRGVPGTKMFGDAGVQFFVNSTGNLCRRYHDGGLKVFEISDREQLAAYTALGFRMISFATVLKRFCVDALGLTEQQCWGTDQDKQTATTLKWDNLPLRVRWKYRTGWVPRSGYMSAREVLQVFGTDLIRSWHPDAWVQACYRAALNCPEPLVLIADARFPNEVDWSTRPPHADDTTIKVVRLHRRVSSDTHASETALDDHPFPYAMNVPAGADMSQMEAKAQAFATPLFQQSRMPWLPYTKKD